MGILAACVTGLTSAADLPKEGKYEFTACWSGASNNISFSKDHAAFSYEMTGTVRSNPPGGLFDNNTFRCVGMNAQLGKKQSATAVCEAVDPDGDKRLTYFSLGADGNTVRENVTGTGKYEGMVASGSVKPVGQFRAIKPGTFQACNFQTGTYKLK
jgi:hypothetical protein